VLAGKMFPINELPEVIKISSHKDYKINSNSIERLHPNITGIKILIKGIPALMKGNYRCFPFHNSSIYPGKGILSILKASSANNLL